MGFGLILTATILLVAAIVAWQLGQLRVIRFFKKGPSYFLAGLLLASVMLNVFATGGQLTFYGPNIYQVNYGQSVTVTVQWEPPSASAVIPYSCTYVITKDNGIPVASGAFAVSTGQKVPISYTISNVTQNSVYFLQLKWTHGSVMGPNGTEMYGPDSGMDNWNFAVEAKASYDPTKDSDDDGFPDVADQCPMQPGSCGGCTCGGGFIGGQITQDTDNDGLSDLDDSCPYIAGPITNAGCPVTNTGGQTTQIIDTDNDGIQDTYDHCPTQAGPSSNNGCPVPTNPIAKPYANFDHEMTDYLDEKYVVQFTNKSSGDITKNTWKVDGDIKTNSTDFTYLFNVNTSYEVELVVEGPGGTDSHIAYLLLAKPTEPTEPCNCDCAAVLGRRVMSMDSTSMVVEYTDQSTGNITYRKWIKNGTLLFEETGPSSHIMNLSSGQKHTIQLEVGNGTCNKTYTVNEDLSSLGGGSLSLFGSSFSIEGFAMIAAILICIGYLILNRGRV